MTNPETFDAWRALALQTRCRAVNRLDAAAARVQIADSVARLREQIAASVRFIGPDTRLVVLPEYVLTGHPVNESIEEWRIKAALDPHGPEYDGLSAIAADLGIWLAGNAYETDRHFPELYFQNSFLIGPGGDVVLRYRRLISMFAPTPHDVWDRYLDLYGLDGVFPVADTPLGRIAAVASEEILFPEISRALALRGAEVIVHSTGETGSPELTPKAVARRARAFENAVAIVSANAAGIDGSAIPAASTDGMSAVVDHLGHVLAESGFGESMVANAEIDIAALRRWRRRPGMGNMLSRQRNELFATLYSDHSVYPANTLLGADGSVTVPRRAHFIERQREALKGLIDAGVLR